MDEIERQRQSLEGVRSRKEMYLEKKKKKKKKDRFSQLNQKQKNLLLL